MRLLIAALCFSLVPLGLYGGWTLYRRATTISLSAPPAFPVELCHDTSRRTGRSLTIALGDSLTRGNMSHDYLADARARLGEGHLLLNAARNGLTIDGLASSLDPVIACQPDQVSILIGTNDAVHSGAPLTDGSEAVARFGLILDRLKTETRARIAVFTLPHAGDDPEGGLNRRTGALSAALARMAETEGVTVLPLRLRQEALLPLPGGLSVRQGLPCNTIEDGRRQMDEIIPRLTRRGRPVDYDQLAAERGYRLVIDCIHLSATGAGPASDLLVDFVTEGDQAARRR